eukprot:TRINITY_DN3213_c0_g2_i1.p1 TRINITY_DN3213_c0_g2~~TRINITY_DN3213_c0_g2_i1.p1  ORF type:complete len:396 (-),score=46.35 TRINITY_DN3213_c0_g2_i1:212-1399(-)
MASFVIRRRFPALGTTFSARTPWVSQRWNGGDASPSKTVYPQPREGVSWPSFGFSLSTRDTKMVIAKCQVGQRWGPFKVMPYGPLSLEPAATVLNYGQAIFEGTKAWRTEKGRIVLFRPQKNGLRFADGARRMLMPPIPTQMFLEACGLAVKENADWVPPVGGGALYLRPMMFGSGADLGVKPSSEYTMAVFVAPVGKYFGFFGGARMQICYDHHRAAPHGVGHVKAAGNYAQCFIAQEDAKADGFSDVIYLDATSEHLEEAAASNFFCVDKDKVVHTPQLGRILPGVTRDSVLQLIRRMRESDIKLKVGKISPKTVMNCSEAFLTGTGAGLMAIEYISSGEEGRNFQCPGPVTQTLQKMLTDIQLERAEDKFGWLYDPFTQANSGPDSFAEPSF